MPKPQKSVFTVIPYLYRDAANYKASSSVVLEGALSAKDRKIIEDQLDSGEYFIPADLPGLDLPELQEQLTSFPSEDDHVWHELSLDEISTQPSLPDGRTSIPVKTFVDAFRAVAAAGGWKVSEAAERLGV